MANMMRSIVFFMMLFSNVAATVNSRLRVYVALYCPIEKQWTYTVEMWESDKNQGDTSDENNTYYQTTSGGGTNQVQVFEMQQVVDDGADTVAEIELRIEHDCNLQNEKVKINRLWNELNIPLGEGDTWAFKAVHLTQPM